jgi:putative transcriptional regulator
MRSNTYLRRLSLITIAVAALVLALAPAPRAQQGPSTRSFLVATPDLGDPMFQHSVIMMLPMTEPPLVAGLIVNKPTVIPVKRMFPNSAALKSGDEIAYLGGPVNLNEPTLVRRSSAPGADAVHVFDDVYASTNPDAIAQLLKSSAPGGDVRVFLGRSQWSTDQLQAETFEGSWYVAPADEAVVFSTDPKDVWKKLVSEAKLQEVEYRCTQAPGVFAPIGCSRRAARSPLLVFESAPALP